MVKNVSVGADRIRLGGSATGQWRCAVNEKRPYKVGL